jgi:hypothetical protein
MPAQTGPAAQICVISDRKSGFRATSPEKRFVFGQRRRRNGDPKLTDMTVYPQATAKWRDRQTGRSTRGHRSQG